jgi:hypothetical protein
MEARDKANAAAAAAAKITRRGSPVHPSPRPALQSDFIGPHSNLLPDDNGEVTTDSEGGIPPRDSFSSPRLVGGRGEKPCDHPQCLLYLSEAGAANISDPVGGVDTNKLHRYFPPLVFLTSGFISIDYAVLCRMLVSLLPPPLGFA